MCVVSVATCVKCSYHMFQHWRKSDSKVSKQIMYLTIIWRLMVRQIDIWRSSDNWHFVRSFIWHMIWRQITVRSTHVSNIFTLVTIMLINCKFKFNTWNMIAAQQITLQQLWNLRYTIDNIWVFLCCFSSNATTRTPFFASTTSVDICA